MSASTGRVAAWPKVGECLQWAVPAGDHISEVLRRIGDLHRLTIYVLLEAYKGEAHAYIPD